MFRNDPSTGVQPFLLWFVLLDVSLEDDSGFLCSGCSSTSDLVNVQRAGLTQASHDNTSCYRPLSEEKHVSGVSHHLPGIYTARRSLPSSCLIRVHFKELQLSTADTENYLKKATHTNVTATNGVSTCVQNTATKAAPVRHDRAADGRTAAPWQADGNRGRLQLLGTSLWKTTQMEFVPVRSR